MVNKGQGILRTAGAEVAKSTNNWYINYSTRYPLVNMYESIFNNLFIFVRFRLLSTERNFIKNAADPTLLRVPPNADVRRPTL